MTTALHAKYMFTIVHAVRLGIMFNTDQCIHAAWSWQHDSPVMNDAVARHALIRQNDSSNNFKPSAGFDKTDHNPLEGGHDHNYLKHSLSLTMTSSIEGGQPATRLLRSGATRYMHGLK